LGDKDINIACWKLQILHFLRKIVYENCLSRFTTEIIEESSNNIEESLKVKAIVVLYQWMKELA
jgi:hypothetical protein